MHHVTTVEALRERLDEWRRLGDHVALVPTMGNLHDGHISLAKIARQHAERVVVTIFVNPSQFGEGEDFADYPRSMHRDKRRLNMANADLLFSPDIETVYPFGVENATRVIVPVLTAEFCGASRPGHFDGVTSVVCRLFGFVQPDIAVFGEKDFQQLQVIRRMVADLGMRVEIVSGPTEREDDGLALSSRNTYLTDQQRNTAPGLYATLLKIAGKLRDGHRDYEQLERQGLEELTGLGFTPDYFGIRRAATLELPVRDHDELVILVAAKLGKTRLIDNLVIAI